MSTASMVFGQVFPAQPIVPSGGIIGDLDGDMKVEIGTDSKDAKLIGLFTVGLIPAELRARANINGDDATYIDSGVTYYLPEKISVIDWVAHWRYTVGLDTILRNSPVVRELFPSVRYPPTGVYLRGDTYPISWLIRPDVVETVLILKKDTTEAFRSDPLPRSGRIDFRVPSSLELGKYTLEFRARTASGATASAFYSEFVVDELYTFAGSAVKLAANSPMEITPGPSRIIAQFESTVDNKVEYLYTITVSLSLRKATGELVPAGKYIEGFELIQGGVTVGSQIWLPPNTGQIPTFENVTSRTFVPASPFQFTQPVEIRFLVNVPAETGGTLVLTFQEITVVPTNIDTLRIRGLVVEQTVPIKIK